ncbi:hypothetical protein [Vagococcus fluvialis]|uniref:hypothetical protein n=1 Tax=Vagococcus fluvialis TaxID=2738 RepID=UPI002B2D837D|nr:hypothetical protein QDW48_11725 [Vagococcus fluvialis]
MNNPEERIKKIREELSIKGIVNVKKERNINKSNTTRYDTKSFTIDHFLYSNYALGEEFLMQEMSQALGELGWKKSDLSGQLYSKKNAGLLISRKPSEEEAELLGRNIAIWSLTELFFEKVSKEMTEYEQLEAFKVTNDEKLDATTETE